MKLLLMLALAACSTNNSPPEASCSGVTVTDGPATGDCALDYGTCSDGKIYELICRELNIGGVDDNGLDCQCEVDGAIRVGNEIGISYTTCAMANTILPSTLEEAWTACGFDVTLGS